MSSSLLSLVDNLSDIYTKEFRGCRKEKMKTVCDFGRLKNNKLHDKCNKCQTKLLTPLS